MYFQVNIQGLKTIMTFVHCLPNIDNLGQTLNKRCVFSELFHLKVLI